MALVIRGASGQYIRTREHVHVLLRAYVSASSDQRIQIVPLCITVLAESTPAVAPLAALTLISESGGNYRDYSYVREVKGWPLAFCRERYLPRVSCGCRLPYRVPGN